MHYKIIYLISKIVKFFITVFIIKNLFISKVYSDECQSFDERLETARQYFNSFEEIRLNLSLRTAFIDNYNKFTKSDNKLEADNIVLFMIFDSNLWYVFASKRNCLVFWIDLEPDRFIEMIDGGTISKKQGAWR